MNTKATRALIEQFFDAWCNRDTAKLAALLPDYVTWTLPEGFRPSGREKLESREDAIAKLITGPGSPSASTLKADTITRTKQELVVEGDTAVSFHRMTAELFSGGTFSADYVWRYTCAEGKVTRLEEFLDTLHVYQQIPDHPLFSGSATN